MERVLVVDDSPDQALMIASVLRSAEFEAETAADGQAALELIADQRPDIVVTDLIMPRLNGLQLVEELATRHPTLPVILMTAYGSGEIAMKALSKGAASYLPKRSVSERLVATIEQILELTRDRLERDRLLGSLLESEARFVLRTDPTLIPPMVNHVRQTISSRASDLGANQLMRLSLALQEALLNAMHHGNLEVASDVREASVIAFQEQVQERLQEAPYRDRVVRLSLNIDDEEVSLVVEDEGPGFDVLQVPDPTDPENLLRASGRGLHLIGTIMDSVRHNAPGNRITMVKRRNGQEQPAA